MFYSYYSWDWSQSEGQVCQNSLVKNIRSFRVWSNSVSVCPFPSPFPPSCSISPPVPFVHPWPGQREVASWVAKREAPSLVLEDWATVLCLWAEWRAWWGRINTPGQQYPGIPRNGLPRVKGAAVCQQRCNAHILLWVGSRDKAADPPDWHQQNPRWNCIFWIFWRAVQLCQQSECRQIQLSSSGAGTPIYYFSVFNNSGL